MYIQMKNLKTFLKETMKFIFVNLFERLINFLADLEQYIDYLIKYISIKENQDNVITNTLLLEELEPKNFDSKGNVNFNFNKSHFSG